MVESSDKMKKKGFTLIELLAVLVILSIIILIAVPATRKIISNAQKAAFEDSIYGIIKAGELYHQSLGSDMLKQEIVLEFPKDKESIKVKGTIPNGIMGIDDTGEIAVGFIDKKYCATKEYGEKKVKVTEDLNNCKMPKVTYINGIMSSGNNCIKKGNYCSKTEILSDEGIKVHVEVAQNLFYDFYVINDENEELTLIMDRNLADKVFWISKEDFEKSGGTFGAYDNTTKGPITLLNTIKERTSKWTNILNYDYIIKDDGWNILYEDIKINSKARALTHAEAIELKIANNDVLPSYLYANLPTGAYWLSSSLSGASNQGTIISSDGSVTGSNVFNVYRSIRPVITIHK